MAKKLKWIGNGEENKMTISKVEKVECISCHKGPLEMSGLDLCNFFIVGGHILICEICLQNLVKDFYESEGV